MKTAISIPTPLFREADTGLLRPSVALVCQVMTVDKEFLTDLSGSLPRRALARLDEGLRLALDLP